MIFSINSIISRRKGSGGLSSRSVYIALAIGASAVLIFFVNKDPSSEATPEPVAEAPSPTKISKNLRPLTAVSDPDTGVLSPKLSKPAKAPKRGGERVRDEIADRVARHGAAETANQLAQKSSDAQGERQAAMEALTNEWAKKDAIAASRWLLANTGEDGATEGGIEPAVWESAVSGYIEGIVESDPDTAARLANLLEPQTRLPVGNPNNRAAPESETKPETIEEILAEVSNSEPTPTITETTQPTVEVSEPTAIAENTPPTVEVDEPTSTADPVTDSTDPFSPEARDARFPGDPGFPGDPDFLSRNRNLGVE